VDDFLARVVLDFEAEGLVELLALCVGGAGQGGGEAAGVFERGFELFGGQSFGLVLADAGEFCFGGVAGDFVFAGQADEGRHGQTVFEGLFEPGDLAVGVGEGPLGGFLPGDQLGGMAVGGQLLSGAFRGLLGEGFGEPLVEGAHHYIFA
jgi:hypothetical protein